MTCDMFGEVGVHVATRMARRNNGRDVAISLMQERGAFVEPSLPGCFSCKIYIAKVYIQD